ncbi:hypothetical protein EMIHUDRAFT_232717 [Emiliania huxleyi CCMP1516]|uniref:Erythromycin biosynthesis protein CIII-like C-terminal domain-containing protein n=2 Tax=Emiliania huxleyi TaxID=2903 RepID=A0A0D3K464_EMIH1|nr:hypothetical protein EMIHUDRAFT_232717 [Emiliania huxleyi CCMP1516]EOD30549.1 hypothetical protein EMIHUDRAFT_232717 [Emiliania huxleyi CCMP1516]|eukprot:XP_005782978.1 hypothetical protein EMIHUDRAFT_232717 [Emiliania huxleyi CCMP1516]
MRDERPLFIGLGTRGTVQQQLYLAQEMQRRGISPLLVAMPVHARLAGRSGVPFTPIMEDRVDPASGVTASAAEATQYLVGLYAAHAETFMQQVSAAATEHRATCVIISSSMVYFLGWLRRQRLPIVHAWYQPMRWNGGRNLGVSYDQVHPGLDADFVAVRTGPHASADLHLLAFPSEWSATHLPGVAGTATGFWLPPADAQLELPGEELRAFLGADGAPVVCLNFGSMRAYEQPWAAELLAALRDLLSRGEIRLLAIGRLVPEAVRSWQHTAWVASVAHAHVFPRCACVVHHCASGTAAAVLAARVPSVAVPYAQWLDQPHIASWLEREGAGVHVRDGSRSEAAFAAAVRRVSTDVALRRGATALGERCARGGGTEAAVRAITAHLARLPLAPAAAGELVPSPGSVDGELTLEAVLSLARRASAEWVTADTALNELDSLEALELHALLEAAAGRPLPTTTVLDDQTARRSSSHARPCTQSVGSATAGSLLHWGILFPFLGHGCWEMMAAGRDDETQPDGKFDSMAMLISLSGEPSPQIVTTLHMYAIASTFVMFHHAGQALLKDIVPSSTIGMANQMSPFNSFALMMGVWDRARGVPWARVRTELRISGMLLLLTYYTAFPECIAALYVSCGWSPALLASDPSVRATASDGSTNGLIGRFTAPSWWFLAAIVYRSLAYLSAREARSIASTAEVGGQWSPELFP